MKSKTEVVQRNHYDLTWCIQQHVSVSHSLYQLFSRARGEQTGWEQSHSAGSENPAEWGRGDRDRYVPAFIIRWVEQNAGKVGCILLSERQMKWESKLQGLPGQHRIIRRIYDQKPNKTQSEGFILDCDSGLWCHQGREDTPVGRERVVRGPGGRLHTLNPYSGCLL